MTDKKYERVGMKYFGYPSSVVVGKIPHLHKKYLTLARYEIDESKYKSNDPKKLSQYIEALSVIRIFLIRCIIENQDLYRMKVL